MSRAAFTLATWLGIGALFGAASDASACSCRRGSVEDAAARARNIALVRVESVRIGPPRSEVTVGDEPPQRARFAVVRHLKGELPQNEELRAGYGLGDCGVPLIVGASYVVFNDGEAPELALCRGFFGPYRLFGDERYDARVMRFIDALDEHLKTGAAIPRPPSPQWGLSDSTAVWFGPPDPPATP